jgi:coenzyme F420 hydrogenase subunit beta
MLNNISKNDTIQKIVEEDLCIGCGSCTIFCPENALELIENQETGTYLPKLDNKKCNKCGICFTICPGVEANFEKLNLEVFDQILKYPVIGNFLSSYAGYAMDPEIRTKSTSGGLIPALAIFAMEIETIGGVLTSRADSKNPLKPKPFIARTKKEILSALGSKYCPVPANSALNEILETQGHYLVIGLPCHIQGLRKVQGFNKKLKNRVALVFGLVCNHTPTFHALNFLLQKFQIPEKKITKLGYRSGGWPGGVDIVLNNGSKHFIPFNSSYYWGLVFQRFFWPKRCIVCNDKLCQLADIIFMDAWLPKYSFDRIGTSLIVARSSKGEKLIKKAIERKVVKLKKISFNEVMESQMIENTIRRVAARRKILNWFSIKPLKFQNIKANPSVQHFLDAFHLLIVNRISRSKSKLSKIIIEFHVKIWDLARFTKKKIAKF